VGAAIALSRLLDIYLKDDAAEKPAVKEVKAETPAPEQQHKNSKEARRKTEDKTAHVVASKKAAVWVPRIASWDLRLTAIVPIVYMMMLFAWHCTWVTSNAYSSPSVVLASRNADGSQFIIDDFREAYYWLRQNTPKDTRVMRFVAVILLGLK
jgi:dolichyl-diphosphooligosaccharide--protein glycosyltransferase